MSDNDVNVIVLICFLGWVPILAIGRAIAMIIKSFRKDKSCNCGECDEV